MTAANILLVNGEACKLINKYFYKALRNITKRSDGKQKENKDILVDLIFNG